MKALFAYNWQVRAEWLQWCRQVPAEELLRERIGGMGSILKTLFHVIDVECSWIQALAKEPVEDPVFEHYMSLKHIEEYNAQCRAIVARYVNEWRPDLEHIIVIPPWIEDEITYTHGEVMRHVLVHEIHHIGQLSIWAREMNLNPVSSNYIDRGL